MSENAGQNGEEETPAGKTVLIVEHDWLSLILLVDIAESVNCKVITARSIQEAQAKLDDENQVDLLVLATQLPGGPGTSLIKACNRKFPNTPIFLTTSSARETKPVMTNIEEVFHQPFVISELSAAIKRCLNRTGEGRPAHG